jgi:hypothetical protein
MREPILGWMPCHVVDARPKMTTSVPGGFTTSM